MVYSGQMAKTFSLPNVELLQMLASSLKTAVLITDAQLDRPGPLITFANQAFARMSGRAVGDVIGNSPKILQQGLRRHTQFEALGRALKHGRRYRGVLKNSRADGSPYYCEVDIRPLLVQDGTVDGYIAFEREAVRTKARPARQQ